MSKALPLVCLGIAQTFASAQTTEAPDLLQRVRAGVADTLTRLPRYTCSMKVERAQYTSASSEAVSCSGLVEQRSNGLLKTRLAETDRLRLDVAVAGSGEIYSWPGANRFESQNPYDFVRQGALGNGAYSGLLSEIFIGDAASFSYKGLTEADGRKLAEFGFKVPIEKSKYAYRNGEGRYVTAYGGTFLADPASGDIVRLSVRTEGLSAGSGACEIDTLLDYSRMRLRDSEFLLPTQMQLSILNNDGSEYRNGAVYSSCREFVGESAIRFGGEGASDTLVGPVRAKAAPMPSLPAGIKLKVRFTQAIDTAAASGGDRVLARLQNAIPDPSSKSTLVPEGAQIAARITRLEQLPGSKSSFRMEVRLEDVEVGGMLVPLKAVANPTIDANENARPFPALRAGGGTNFGSPPAAPTQRKPTLLGRLRTDPGIYVFEFREEKPGFVIKAGLESSWVTVK